MPRPSLTSLTPILAKAIAELKSRMCSRKNTGGELPKKSSWSRNEGSGRTGKTASCPFRQQEFRVKLCVELENNEQRIHKIILGSLPLLQTNKRRHEAVNCDHAWVTAIAHLNRERRQKNRGQLRRYVVIRGARRRLRFGCMHRGLQGTGEYCHQ